MCSISHLVEEIRQSTVCPPFCQETRSPVAHPAHSPHGYDGFSQRSWWKLGWFLDPKSMWENMENIWEHGWYEWELDPNPMDPFKCDLQGWHGKWSNLRQKKWGMDVNYKNLEVFFGNLKKNAKLWNWSWLVGSLGDSKIPSQIKSHGIQYICLTFSYGIHITYTPWNTPHLFKYTCICIYTHIYLYIYIYMYIYTYYYHYSYYHC